MADTISLSVQPRSTFGKKNKALRRLGLVPVHVYGQDKEPLSLQVENLVLRSTLRQAGATTPVTIQVDGGEETVTLVREIAVHPVSGNLLHVDFMRVNIAQEVQAEVPLRLINDEDAPGTRGGAGVVTQGTYEISVNALPFDIPSEIEVDCSVLIDLETDIKASELTLPNGVTLLSDADTRIAWIQPPRVVEEVAAAEIGDGEEGAEAAEGEDGDEAASEDDGE